MASTAQLTIVSSYLINPKILIFFRRRPDNLVWFGLKLASGVFGPQMETDTN